jgi:predicted permease
MNTLLARIRAFFRKREMDGDLDQELAAHLEMAVEENLRRGLSPEEARRQALIRFGGVEMAREHHRDARGLPQLDSLVQDVRYAFRTLRRDAGFTVAALLILALGIGVNTAVFSVVNTVLLHPLPFRDADRLVWVEDTVGEVYHHVDLSSRTFPVDVFEAMRGANRSFTDMTAYDGFFGQGDYKLLGRGEPERLVGVRVAGNFFPLLGVQPVLGRLFMKEECQKNGRKAVLLSHGLWERRFGSDPSLVGQSLTLNNDAVTVAGVLPATFDLGSVFSPGVRVDIYLPAVMDDMRNDGNELVVIGRLKPGVRLETAQAEFRTLAPQFRRAHPDYYADIDSRLVDLKRYVTGRMRASLIALWCAVGLVLLIVCVNMANLLLARSVSRGKEFAIRRALGAGRYRIVRQLLTESLMLSGGGAVLGLAVAFALTHFLAASQTIALPLLRDVRVDGTALGFTVLAAVGAALLFGLAPGFATASGRTEDSLKESARGASEGKGQGAFRASLVVAEVGLACVLFSGAGLLLRSFLRLLEVDLGFQPSHAFSLRLDYDYGAKQAKLNAYFGEVLRRVTAAPGIEAAGITDALPMGQNRSWGMLPKGRSYPRDQLITFVNMVAPGYLEAMGMHMRAGRGFNWHDTDTSEPVLLVNETLARRAWPGEDAVGKEVQMDSTHFRRVVGVVANVRETSLEEQAGAAMFLPIMQTLDLAEVQLIVRSKLQVESVTPGVKAALRSLDLNQPVRDLQPLEERVDRVASPRRFFAVLVSGFALFGLLLASLGIYGVISYSVTRRTKEIGIRMALGATPRAVRWNVVGGTLRLALIGIGAGTVASLMVSRLIASLLFGVSPADPATFLGMVMVLGLVAVAAGYVPARRASRVDPTIALRAD